MLFDAAVRASLALSLALLVGGAPVLAQSELGAERDLEILWQTSIAPDPRSRIPIRDLRLRVSGEGRITFAVTQHEQGRSNARALVLLTVDGTGRIAHRAAVALDPATKDETFAWNAAVPLPGGEFLLQVTTKRQALMTELRRYAGDGTLLSVHAEPLPKETSVLLHDAAVLADGRLVVAGSDGPGPNDRLWVVVLDPAGRVLWRQRAQGMLPGAEWQTRIYAAAGQGKPPAFHVLGNGLVPVGDGSPQYIIWLKSFGLEGGAPVAMPPWTVDRGATLACSAMAGDGSAVIAATAQSSADRGVSMRWLDAARKVRWVRVFEAVRNCHIMLRPDGQSLAWLGPRRLLMFDKDAKVLWRATLEADAVAVEAMANGDVVAIHATDAGIRVARYAVR